MKKSEWGPCVWKVLHTLTIKIKDEYFEAQRKKLFEIIQLICNNLPCPMCSSHATSFLKKHRLSQIKTKEQLIRFIYEMHNDVNKRLKKEPFMFESLLSSYENMNFRDVMNQYYISLSNINFGEKMMLYSFHRKLFLKNFRNYIISNIDCFHI
jgi:hypothetical protein